MNHHLMSLDPVIYEALVSRAIQAAEATVISRIDLYFTIFGGFVALVIFSLGFVGFSQIREIRKTFAESISRDIEAKIRASDDFKAQIRSAVEHDVSEGLRSDTAKLSATIDILRLSAQVKEVEESDSFSHAQRDNLYESLIRLRENPEVFDSIEYKSAFGIVLESFYRAGLFGHLMRLEEQFAGLIESEFKFLNFYLQTYGMQYFGEMTVEPQRTANIESKLLHYCRVASDLKYPEFALLDQLAHVLWREGGTNEKSDNLVADIQDLDIREKFALMDSLNRRSDPAKLSHNPKASHKRFSKHFARVRELYAEVFSAIDEELAKAGSNFESNPFETFDFGEDR